MELHKGRPDHATAIASLESSPPDPDTIELWQWRLAGAAEAVPIVVAEQDGEVVGLVWVDLDPAEATTGRLRGLYVDPGHRRSGNGHKLLLCGQRLLVKAGAERGTMEQTEDAGLAAVARRLGWEHADDEWHSDLAEVTYLETNRWNWDDLADWYVEAGRTAFSPEARRNPRWGIYGVLESDVALLPDLADKEVVELGCGTGYVSAWCLEAGAATAIGLDNSPAQLATAKTLQTESGVTFPLVWGDADNPPFADQSFDVAISEYGAAIWCDPYQWIPEAARLLRPGGTLVFLGNSVALTLCVEDFETDGAASAKMRRPQKGMHRFAWPDSPGLEFHISHGDMIRLLNRSGFEVVDLIELYVPADATSRYDFVDKEWGSKWPIEEAWVARRRDD